MQLKTILNRVHPVKGFVYGKQRIVADTHPLGLNNYRIEVEIQPRRGSRGVCSGCGRRGPTYDTQAKRRFDFVPMLGMAVVFLYAMRRIDCSQCGVKVECVPWAEGKSPVTHALAWFLSRWAKRLSWAETACAFGVSWDRVHRAVQWAVSWGLQHRDLEGIEAIGVDEVAWRKGHKYLTLVYQIDSGLRRLLHIEEGRTVRSLLGFFRMLGRKRAAGIRYVCSDMWKPYLKVIAKKLPQSIHILDRYHIVANVNKAIDRVRAEESKRLAREGYEAHLKRSRWCLLKREENLTDQQRVRLKELMCYDLKTVRAYLKAQALHLLWDYTSPAWAGKYLDAWCRDVMRSRIDPMKKVARSLRKHRELILNWFRAKKQFNAGIVEGMNTNVKLAFRKAYGYRTAETAKIALYHQLGDLPEPQFTHRFC